MNELPTTRIAYINGFRLHRALLAGVRRVVRGSDHINKINVFPVPDADTGTNLSLTLDAIVKGASSSLSRHVGQTLMRVADSALDGARGNSGAILAQFLQGVCDTCDTHAVLTPRTFAVAVQAGSDSAAEAISEPRDGTMLSVIRDYAHELGQQLHAGVDDIVQLLANGLTRARLSLARTPEQLSVLRDAGVVDAGAQGFVYLLEGIQEYIESGSLRELPVVLSATPEDDSAAIAAGTVVDLAYRYCTECVITGDDIDRRKVRELLNEIEGNSLVLAGTKYKARVHMHVTDPASLFAVCESFGAIRSRKADDMKLQQAETHQLRRGVAIVTDSAADLPESEAERLSIHMVPLRVHFGDRQFLDRVSLSPEDFYQRLRESSDYPRTSQPPPGDFRRQFEFLSSHYEGVVSIHISGQLSGTLQGARTAAGRLDHARVGVFDSLNASTGQGLLAMYAAEAAKDGLSLQEVMQVLELARSRTRTYGAINDLGYGVRGGRIPAVFKRLADVLRLRPVVAANREGRIVSRGIMLGRRNMAQKFARSLRKRIKPGVSYRFMVGHCDDEPAGQGLHQALLEVIGQVHSSFVTMAGTAFGVHAGPGTLVVALQEYEPPLQALESLKALDS